jgi:hypothetical protein
MGIVPMNDEDKPAIKAGKKPARRRKRHTAEPAALRPRTSKAARVSVHVVPTLPDAAPAPNRHASVLRLGLLTSTLALVVGGMTLLTHIPASFTATPGAISSVALAPTDPLPPHVRESLDHERRLAAMALDVRQAQDTIVRLADDARVLTASVGAFTSRIDHIKSDLGETRVHTAAARARIEEGLKEVRTTVLEPVLLGDPALRQLTPGYAEIDTNSTTTGGVLEKSPAPDGTVTVAFNNRPEGRLKRTPITGWYVHYADRDHALLATKDVFYRVRAGHVLPGPGTVRAIKRRGNQWVVLTSNGVISEGR